MTKFITLIILMFYSSFSIATEVVTSLHPSGTKKNETTYAQGKRNGLYMEWDENGKKTEEGKFIDDLLDGVITMWHPNGQRSAIVTYQKGVPVGRYTMWHSNGKISQFGGYANGKLDGEIKKYNQEGKVEAVYKFKNGQQIFK